MTEEIQVSGEQVNYSDDSPRKTTIIYLTIILDKAAQSVVTQSNQSAIIFSPT